MLENKEEKARGTDIGAEPQMQGHATIVKDFRFYLKPLKGFRQRRSIVRFSLKNKKVV